MSKAELQDYMINRIGLANCIAFQKNTYSRDGVPLPHYQYYPPDYELKVPCGKCAERQSNKCIMIVLSRFNNQSNRPL